MVGLREGLKELIVRQWKISKAKKKGLLCVPNDVARSILFKEMIYCS
jgi:hypothetical protein